MTTPNLLLYSANFGENPSFKALPTTSDAPYLEIIYDTDERVLVVIMKFIKQSFTTIPKLNSVGDVERIKKPRLRGQTWAEQRVYAEMLPEFFITDPKEQIDFIKRFCVNADVFPYFKIIDAKSTKAERPSAEDVNITVAEEEKSEDKKLSVVQE